MKRLFFLIPLLLLLAGCEIGGIRGNGHIVTEQRATANFVNLQTGGAFNVEWHAGAPSISITTDENLLKYITTSVDGNVLHLSSDETLRPHRGVKVVLTSSSLEAAKLNGASRLDARGLSGAKFYLESNGASRIAADGNVTELIAIMNGASRFDGEKLQTRTSHLEINGAGKAVVTVTDSLKASIAGAGRVDYLGHPQHVEKDISGAGSIRARD